MATIYYKIFEHHKKKSGKLKGTYNIKYCLTHKGKQVYHASERNAEERQLKKDFSIKDSDLLAEVMADVSELKRRLDRLSLDTDNMTASEVLHAITKPAGDQAEIDFIAFSKSHMESLKKSGRIGTARTFRPVINNLIDFFGTDSVPVTQITSANLRKFEAFLSSTRKQVRLNQFKEEVKTTRKGLGPAGIHNTMRDLRILFNACRTAYNTEFNTLITHYPFDYYKIAPPPPPKKKGAGFTVADVKFIRDMPARQGSRKELSRDIFMLSFYLVGMNAKDIYKQDWTIEGKRILYSRSKTMGRRDDSAVIGVSIPDEAIPLLEKYTRKMLHRRYTSYDGYLTAIDKGMQDVSDAMPKKKKVTFYHARHLLASFAYNICKFTKEEIAEALNHANKQHKVTESYIAADWSVVDKVQAGVLELLTSDDDVKISIEVDPEVSE